MRSFTNQRTVYLLFIIDNNIPATSLGTGGIFIMDAMKDICVIAQYIATKRLFHRMYGIANVLNLFFNFSFMSDIAEILL